ncbi:MAG: hypothetical protein mread185_000087 [Mycoplasmataceae bacterium]|nr:MAG: hypothetical protein mread185_000087 [Mycoplasmataceae bacterium]
MGYEPSELQQLQAEKQVLQDQLTELQQTSANWKQNYQTNLQILTQLQEFHSLVEKSDSHSLDRKQVNQAESLVEQITQPQIKQLASWMVTDSVFILGHNNLLTKLAEQEDKNEELREQQQEQLRKINLLFDANAGSYEIIDFNGLYALLTSIAEREREQKLTIKDDEINKNLLSHKEKKKTIRMPGHYPANNEEE